MNSTRENTTTQPARGYGELLRRSGFASLLAAQALAVFDDNTFRQLLALFIAAHVASIETRNPHQDAEDLIEPEPPDSFE